MAERAGPHAAWIGRLARLVAVTALWCTIPAAAGGDDPPLTLEAALASVDENHPRVHARAAELARARAALLEAEAHDDLEVELRLRGRYIEPSPIAFDRGNNDSTVAIVATKRLFDFGRTGERRRAATETAEGARLRLEQALAEQRLAVIRHYFAVLLADLEHARDTEAMAVRYVQADRARERHELNQIPEVERLAEEERYQRLRSRWLRSRDQTRLARARLANAMNRPGELPGELAWPQHLADTHPLPEYQELLARAMSSSRVLAALRHDLEAARRALAAARAESWPVISAGLSAEEGFRQVGSRSPFAAELRIDVPLYRGARVQARIARAQADLQSVRARLAEAEHRLQEELLETWLRIRTLQAERQRLDTFLAYSEARFEAAQARYELELATDFGDALVGQSEAALLEAEIELGLALARARLAVLLGADPDHLLEAEAIAP